MSTTNDKDYQLAQDLSDRISENEFLKMVKQIYADKRNDLKKRVPISIRIAMTIVMENEIVLEHKKRNELIYDRVKNNARSSYNVKNSNWKNFPTLDDIHPENPCLKYEENNRVKGRYKRGILQIIFNSEWLLNNDKLNQKFESIYEEVDMCS